MTARIDYGHRMHLAMQGLLADLLRDVAEDGLPGDHHFFITFDLDHPGVDVSAAVRANNTSPMTIVLQHMFDNLAVMDDRFTVTLSFKGVREALVIPFAAIETFADPSVEFGLRFDAREVDDVYDDEEDDEDEDEDEAHDAEIVRLDTFRKPER